MKSRRIEAIAREHLLPKLPGFGISRKIIFRKPVLPILRGFAFDDSDYDADAVFVVVFVLPLYLPVKHLTFTFGHRLENRKGFLSRSANWILRDPIDEPEKASMLRAIQTKGIPFLDRLNTPEDIVRHLTLTTKLIGNVFVEQAIAFSLAKLGNFAEARPRLVAVRRSVKPTDAWQHVAQSSERLIEAIDNGTAESLFEQWTSESIHNLRLDMVAAE